MLEEASRQKSRALSGQGFGWLQVRLRLAELYREVGRIEEALQIEDDLRRYCTWADPDWVFLKNLGTGTSIPGLPPA